MKKTKNYWLGLVLVGIAISVPEGTLIRLVGDSVSVSVMTLLRYTVAAVFAVPFIIAALKKNQLTPRRMAYMMLIAIPLALDPLISQYVIETTNASFQAILSLSTPIIFVIVSTIITKDRMSRNKILGFMFAVLGGMVMTALPNFSHGAVTSFGPLPVVLMLVQGLCISIEAIVWRRESELGTPLVAILGVFYFVWAIIAAAMALLFGQANQIHHLSVNSWLIVGYLGIIASITYNAVFTDFYRHVGTTNAATMKYLKKALTIVMPIIVLGETLNWEIALGILLIVIGTIVAHKQTAKKKARPARARLARS
jgi:drug/metabolite transporter (DMT)-like permease